MADTTAPSVRRPSMADVGRAAAVSAQTVSRFYTGGYVSAETRNASSERSATSGTSTAGCHRSCVPGTRTRSGSWRWGR